MSFLDEVKISYESGYDSLGKDFIYPALKECVLYKRETAWFKSSALRVWAGSLVNILQNENCKIEIIAFPQIDQSTFRALKDSLSEEKRRNILREHRERILLHALDIDAVADIHDKETGKKVGQLLSYLIASGKLEIKFAQMLGDGQVKPEIIPDDFEGELTHNKRGYFVFPDKTVLAFQGSANESVGGLMVHGESFHVYNSRKENHKEFLDDVVDKVDKTWAEEKPGYIVEPVSRKVLDRIKKFAPQKPPVFPSPTPAPTPAPTEKPADTIETPDWFWDHKKDAIEAYFQNNKGILQMATGTGKTSTGLEIARQLFLNKRINRLIISPGTGSSLLSQWVDDVYEWTSNISTDFRIFQCIGGVSGVNQSLEFINTDNSINSIIVVSRKAEDLRYLLENISKEHTLIIQDEVHSFGAPGLYGLKDLHKNFKYTLGLSATPDRMYDEEGSQFIIDEIGDVIYEFPLEQAITSKVLCPFNYHPVPVFLTDEDNVKRKRIITAYESQKNTPTPMSLKDRNIQLARVSGIAETKPMELGKFFKKNSNLIKNSIIFCAEWNPQATLVCEEVMKYTTSFIKMNTNKKDEQKKAIAELGKGVDCIITCHSLSEGIDIPSLENVFLIASYRSPLETIQRIGRCIRTDPNNPKKIANVIDCVVHGSDGKLLNADEVRSNWIKEVSKVRPDG